MNNEELSILIESGFNDGLSDEKIDNLIDKIIEEPDDRNYKLWAENIIKSSFLL